MYYYVYDEFVQDRKYERELANIETRLTDLGINGKIARLALFRDPAEMIRDEVRRGAVNVVAVGNDVTLRKVIDAVSEMGATLGIIPLGKEQNFIADQLGMPHGEPACESISARRVVEIDAGEINNAQFLHQVQFKTSSNCAIDVEGQYRMHVPKGSHIRIRNMANAEEGIQQAHPADGKLELVIQHQEKKWLGKKQVHQSFLAFSDIHLHLEASHTILVDGQEHKGHSFKVNVLQKQIRLITGKDRSFAASE